ncbi:hypothetical protein MNBD_GAMMA09-1172 [hydrothermal vent metagenome]|uniref:Chromosomal replication initiator protein DnaA domain-containing protein n=1 Tax=hydrothermal vent metagenome TaxID=652676 RepID=A0A3B0YPH7_9ZZZZ
MQLPFLHLNLYFNPFGELDCEQRKQLAVVNLSEYKQSLYNKGLAIQFYADHGRGKTTHLLALHNIYPDAEYIKLYAGDKPEIFLRDILFIDSIENLSKRKRTDLYRNTASIAFTSHTDLSPEIRQAGYQLINIKISVADNMTLKYIFNRRIEYARRTDHSIPVVGMPLIYNLRQRYGDNVRAMEAHLYEIFQNLKGISNVKM